LKDQTQSQIVALVVDSFIGTNLELQHFTYAAARESSPYVDLHVVLLLKYTSVKSDTFASLESELVQLELIFLTTLRLGVSCYGTLS
jgi:hypothetical protein